MANDITQPTSFDLPVEPEQFSVLLPPTELRRLDFSALEFPTSRRAIIEYIKSYYPGDFNDFSTNNGVIMLVELCAYLASLLSLRADILSNEAFLPTAQSEDAVTNHLALINQKFRRATPAVVDIECTLDSPSLADVHINAGVSLQVRGSDGSNINYELFAAPGDFTSDIIIPAGKRGVIGYGVHGKTSHYIAEGTGLPDQKLIISDREILDYPVVVSVTVDGEVEQWHRIDFIERADSDENAFEVRHGTNRMELIFGNGTTGRVLPASAKIDVLYRTGGGIKGRIGVGVLDSQLTVAPLPPYTAPIMVRFRNVTPSSGGTDRESLDEAKKRAPRDFATQGVAITDLDYAQLSRSFSHPVHGTISKAMATVRTSRNANLVEVYALAQGPDGVLETPSEGLKKGLASYLDEINVLTDSVEVKDGAILAVSVKMSVVMNKNADASLVKGKVEKEVSSFFDSANWDMGQPLYLSQLYERVNKLDGVSFVDIFEPADNILPIGRLAGAGSDPTVDGVAINEVIALGNLDIQYFYENSMA